ncbi:hypothetical protein HDU86_005161 [Geranomyces michiganensis]|nr:hypothetical protein HDU86_005161 [Geranomyces michiganensis]
MPRAQQQPHLVVGVVCLLSATLTTVAAFDPTPSPTPLAANATLTLPALSCDVLTYTLPANHSLSLSLSVSPPLLSLGFTTDPAQPCAEGATAFAVAGTDYVQILDTTTAKEVNGAYALNNITAARCWTAPVTLRFFAATAFPAANGREGAADAKSVAVGNIVVLPTGNRTCVSPPAPSGAATAASPTAADGGAQGTGAAGAKQSWSLAPPPPGSSYVQSGSAAGTAAAAADLAGGLAGLLAVVALAFV